MTLEQAQAEQERMFPGFIARTQVAAATRAAQLANIPFSGYNSQKLLLEN
jgi:hypothetical protein